jgi:hypothetical protein
MSGPPDWLYEWVQFVALVLFITFVAGAGLGGLLKIWLPC